MNMLHWALAHWYLVFVHQFLWIAAGVVELVLFLVGLPITYALSRKRAWYLRPSKYFIGRTVNAWMPTWAWPWGNEENGVDGPSWYAAEHPQWSAEHRAFMWSGLRNSVNNLRFLPFFGIAITPKRVHYIGNSTDPDTDYATRKFLWFYCWQGFFAGFWLVAFGFQLRLGWKLLPKDQKGVASADYRTIACGTGWQIQRK